MTRHMAQWYKLIVYQAHQGAGIDREVPLFLYVHTPIDAMLKAKTIRGIKRDKIPLSIQPLSPYETQELEARINSDFRTTIDEARTTEYYPAKLDYLENTTDEFEE